ncbi:MAG TPA: transglutaminase domain-containing protein [Myxococcota bacterium]|nr:transglutaminase domain-containing protein [Myxococcota bacterium]
MSREHPDFIGRARAEGLRYGEDAWVFLRELGQNARDAKASSIDIRTAEHEGLEKLVFSDDGGGMTFEHARRYLFRLYASSKDDDPHSAGCYGVGFWSVLRFAPDLIEVHSVCGKESWAVELNGDLEHSRRISCNRRGQGTSVVLRRQSRTGPSLAGLVASAVSRYLAHLRTAGRRARPLPVSLDGRPMQRPFWLEGSCALAFKDGPVEGVVGFGERPSYVLYARGLPVKKGDYIDELEGRIRKRRPHDEREGTCPVFLLCGNDLDVDLTRMTVVRDQRLDELLRTARRRFDELIRRMIDKTVGRSPLGRLWDGLTGAWRSLSAVPRWTRWALVVPGLLCLGWLLGLLAFVAGPKTGVAAGGRVVWTSSRAAGAMQEAAATGRQILQPVFKPQSFERIEVGTVNTPAAEPGWALEYRPPRPLLFRIAAFEDFDLYKGFLSQGSGRDWRPPVKRQAGKETIDISLAIQGRPGGWLIPVPTGYEALAGGARIGQRQIEIEFSREGLLKAWIPADMESGDGMLRLDYRVVPSRRQIEGGAAGTGADEWANWPPEIEEILEQASELPLPERIDRLTAMIQRIVGYDRSRETALAYAASRQTEWVRKVLEIGYGDCDVVNGLLALALRETGVPARLAVGLVGHDGRVLPGTHAWVEIEDQGLRAIDATVGMPERSGHVPKAAAAAASSHVSPARGQRLLVTAISAGAFLLLVATIILIYARNSTRKLRITKSALGQRELLANLAMDAVRRPQAWRDIRGLWQRRFIPCLGGKHVSLQKIAKLGRQGRLFVGEKDGQLASQAANRGALVLDESDEAFRDLYPLLPNARYLEEIERYKPLPPGSGPAWELLAEVDDFLVRTRAGARCRATGGLSDRLYRDIDLSPIRPRSTSGWFRRFLAVNLEHALWQALAGVYKTSPRLAVCMAADRLALNSWLLADQAARLRRLAVRRTLDGRRR